MAGQDVYQLVLQLKDELSANLKMVQSQLGKTKQAGEEVSKHIDTLGDKFRKTAEPIRDFSRMMREIMGFGGAAIVAQRIAAAIGNMQLAYEKVNPAAAQAFGSLTMWNAAMVDMKAKMGGALDSVLTPIRAFFLSLMDPLAEVTQQVRLLNAEFDTLVTKYGTDAFKNIIAYNDAVATQLRLMNDITAAMQMQAELKSKLMLATAAAPATIGEGGGIDWGAVLAAAAGGAFTAGNVSATQAQTFAAQQNTKYIDDLNKQIKALADVIKKNQDLLAHWKWPGEKPEGPWAPPKGNYPSFMSLWMGQPEIAKEIQQDISNIAWDQLPKNLKLGQETIDAIDALRKQQTEAAYNASMLALVNPEQAANNLIQAAGLTTANAVTAAGPSGMGLGDIVDMFFGSIMDSFEALTASLGDFSLIVLLVVGAIEILNGITEILQPAIEGIWKPFQKVLHGIGNAVGTLLLPIFQALEAPINAICDVLGGILTPIFILLKPIFDGLALAIKIAFIPVIAFCILIKTILNLIIDSINWAFGWLGVNLPKLPISEFPTFHQGGVAQDDMVALLRKGEIVLNPYKSRAYIAGGEMGSGITIIAPNARYLDANTAAELVRMGLVAMRA